MFVKLFIKHILGVDADHPGIFGDVDSYFGVVEQQGRLTLHLHLLLWIKNSLTPAQIRERLKDINDPFYRELVSWLESVSFGEFMSGSKQEVMTNCRDAESHSDYRNPSETLPTSPPPPGSDESVQRSWWASFKSTVDDLLSQVNLHTECSTNLNKDGRQNAGKSYIGCLNNKWRRCIKRFPRDVVEESTVDRMAGTLKLKHLEPYLNRVTPIITYLCRSNSDTTCLLSGTAVKAVILYVSNYVTKTTLKTHVVFSTIRDVYNKNKDVLLSDKGCDPDTARRLTVQMVNQLSAKMELGSPMAAMYVLGNPDYYSSHRTRMVPFFWNIFVREARKAWGAAETADDSQPEKLMVVHKKGRVVGLSRVFDYIYRPVEFEHMCLYDWVRLCTRVKLPKSDRRVNTSVELAPDLNEPEPDAVEDSGAEPSSVYLFMDQHPLSETHGLRCRPIDSDFVPNFIGPQLPRRDGSDREYYCSTMLTLFKPWRSGEDLRHRDQLWHDAFSTCKFTQRHLQLMNFFHIRYECLDAQDDFRRQMDADSGRPLPDWYGSDDTERYDFENDDFVHPFDDTSLSVAERRRRRETAEISRVIVNSGWDQDRPDVVVPDAPNISDAIPSSSLRNSAHDWNAVLEQARQDILDQRAEDLRRSVEDAKDNSDSRRSGDGFTSSDPEVVTSRKSDIESTRLKKADLDLINEISNCGKRKLNEEQSRAFMLAAKYACTGGMDQLKLYVAGMAGTGKSELLRTMRLFFSRRNESHRMLVVAPTGSAAANVSASTYHWLFGINDLRLEETLSPTRMAEIKDRIDGADFLYVDEVSMVPCEHLHLISLRLCQVLNKPHLPFGGMHVIFTGDFAQLPPVQRLPLYSRKVGLKKKSKPDQMAAMGKALWHQVTHVIILRRNMRQQLASSRDGQLRTCLENLRYKDCTSDDIAFLNSLVSSPLPSRPNIADANFRHASIVTARHVVKDEFDCVGTLRFAKETGSRLCTFYSEDTVAGVDVIDGLNVRKPVRKKVRRTIDENVQEALWDTPPRWSEGVPGKLTLCKGLPVMIRYNTVTELCITRGQEGVVHSWTAMMGPRGRPILDTVFVKLKNPPQNIKISGLPDNVVPVTRRTQSVKCTLPDGSKVTIQRSQVHLIPNFAMTDYNSQGKGIKRLVCEFSQSHSVQNIYTALSRSHSADSILLLQGIDPAKLTGSLDGELRQEFRELEVLDEITRLKCEDALPDGVYGDTRYDLIDSFRSVMGSYYNPPRIHKKLKWSKKDPWLDSDFKDAEWDPSKSLEEDDEDGTSQSGSSSTSNGQASPNVHVFGPVWDRNSCAYDVVTAVFYNIWRDDSGRWNDLFRGIGNDILTSLTYWFSLTMREKNDPSYASLENARDCLRSRLIVVQPDHFIMGCYAPCDLILEQSLLTRGVIVTSLEGCTNHIVERPIDSYSMYLHVPSYEFCGSVDEWIGNMHSVSHRTCTVCARHLVRMYHINELTPLFVVALFDGHRLTISVDVTVNAYNGSSRRYELRGVIYHGDFHYVARVILGKKVWLYDGMKNSVIEYEGLIDTVDLDRCGRMRAVNLVYALAMQ